MKTQNNKKIRNYITNNFYNNEFMRYLILYAALFILIIAGSTANTDNIDAEQSTTHKICSNVYFQSSLYADSALHAFRYEGYDAILWHLPVDTRCLNVTYFDDELTRAITYNTNIWYEYEKQFWILFVHSVNDSGKTFSDIPSAEKTLNSLEELMLIWINEKTNCICFSFYSDSSKNEICTFESEIPTEKWEKIKELLVTFVMQQK